VEHAVVRHFKPDFASDFSGSADLIIDCISRHQSFGSKREGKHLPGLGIDLRMGREGLTGQTAVEIPVSLGLQAQRIHRNRWTILLHCEQHAVMNHDIGIRESTILAPNARLVCKGIAITPKQGAARFSLKFEPIGAHVAVLQVDPPILKAEHRNGAIGIERNIIFKSRRILEIRSDTVKGSIEIGGYVAIHFQVVNIDFDPARRVDAFKHWEIGKFRHGPSSLPRAFREPRTENNASIG
jgi:hypothetical protein